MKITYEECRAIRKALGLAQLDVACRAGLSQGIILFIENGYCNPTHFDNYCGVLKTLVNETFTAFEKAHKIKQEKLLNEIKKNSETFEFMIKIKLKINH